MYICNRFFLCMKILRGKKAVFCKDSLVVFTHKFVNLGRKAPLVKGWPFFKHTIMTFPCWGNFRFLLKNLKTVDYVLFPHVLLGDIF